MSRDESEYLREKYLDELGAPNDHAVRERAKEVATLAYDSETISAEARSIEAGAVYFATQVCSEYNSISQTDIAQIAGVSVTTISRMHTRMVKESEYVSSRIQ